jgi:predicted DNA-binding transcriptional regulator AlpA
MEQVQEQERLLKRNDVALILGVSERTVRRIMVRDLPVVRVGRNPRYRPSDVQQYINARVVE